MVIIFLVVVKSCRGRAEHNQNISVSRKSVIHNDSNKNLLPCAEPARCLLHRFSFSHRCCLSAQGHVASAVGPHPASLTRVRMGMWGHSSPETVHALLTPRTQQGRGLCTKKCEPKVHGEVSFVTQVDKSLGFEKEWGVQLVLPRAQGSSLCLKCASSKLHCT